MTNFFSKQDPRIVSDKAARYRAVNYVREWLTGRPYLDKQLVAALHHLIPELKPGQVDEFEHHRDFD